jgi:hypothetical protein
MVLPEPIVLKSTLASCNLRSGLIGCYRFRPGMMIANPDTYIVEVAEHGVFVYKESDPDSVFA